MPLSWNEIKSRALTFSRSWDDAQREDARAVFAGIDNAGLLDFVAAWYVKAARYMRGLATPSPSGGGQGWGPAAHPKADASSIAASPHPHLPPAGEGASPRAAFVSTNSIVQGEQVGVLWGWPSCSSATSSSPACCPPRPPCVRAVKQLET